MGRLGSGWFFPLTWVVSYSHDLLHSSEKLLLEKNYFIKVTYTHYNNLLPSNPPEIPPVSIRYMCSNILLFYKQLYIHVLVIQWGHTIYAFPQLGFYN